MKNFWEKISPEDLKNLCNIVGITNPQDQTKEALTTKLQEMKKNLVLLGSANADLNSQISNLEKQLENKK
jgi:hypothetical protein